MDTKADALKGAIFSLNAIHKGVATLQHGIKERSDGENGWKEYFPSHFIYAFFAFNTLYNVDWEKSYKQGRLNAVPKITIRDNYGKVHIKEQDEYTKQQKYLNFCFQNKEFVRLYKEFFIRYVVGEGEKEDIKDILSGIRGDDVPNGRIRTSDYIRIFQISVDDLLFRGKFDQDTIEKILGFIYSVRCNIFHGVKSIHDMKNYEQQDRLDVYASIIIALNQMVFSYLDFLIDGVAIRDRFDKLYEELF